MAGLDCAEISATAWPSLRDGIAGMVTVADPEAHAAMRELAGAGLAIGDCGAAPLAGLRALATEDACAELRAAVGLGRRSRVLLIATEGATDPDAYRARSHARLSIGAWTGIHSAARRLRAPPRRLPAA